MLLRSVVAAALPLLSLAASFDCRPPGPVVPRPTNVGTHPLFLAAARQLTESLQKAVSGEINAGWPVENTSFSVGFVTKDQPDKKIPIWEHHFLAPNNIRGTRELTRDSQYLINSISKVITDYILLRSGISLEDSAAKHIPVLRNSTSINWDKVTLRQLASGLSGLPPGCEYKSPQLL
jgi:CubicO group peptidase (beta-lactamase class C family)